MKIWKIHDLPRSKSFTDCSSVWISNYLSMGQFAIVSSSDQDKIQLLQDGIAEYCQKAPNVSRYPSVDDIIFAPDGYGIYYRVKILSIHPHLSTINLKVISLDSGVESLVDLADCKEPSYELMTKHPLYAILFSLDLESELPDGLMMGDLEDILHEISIVGNSQLVMKITSQPSYDELTGKLYFSNNKTVNDMLEGEIKKTCSNLEATKMAKKKRQPASQLLPSDMFGLKILDDSFTKLNISYLECSQQFNQYRKLMCRIYKIILKIIWNSGNVSPIVKVELEGLLVKAKNMSRRIQKPDKLPSTDWFPELAAEFKDLIGNNNWNDAYSTLVLLYEIMEKKPLFPVQELRSMILNDKYILSLFNNYLTDFVFAPDSVLLSLEDLPEIQEAVKEINDKIKETLVAVKEAARLTDEFKNTLDEDILADG